MTELKDRVLKRRKLLGLTQEQLAKKVGVKQQSIQQLEDGLVKRPRYLLELSEALECDAGWLSSGKGSANFNLTNGGYQPGREPASQIQSEILSLMPNASPRSQQILLRIAEAAGEGRIDEADLILLGQIADRIASKE